MTPWTATLDASSSHEQFAYWGRLRSLGRGYYLRTCVLFWCSVAIGVGGFLDLMYHFIVYGAWRIGLIWLGITLFAAIISAVVYSRRWALGEQQFKDNAQRSVSTKVF
ncbi:MAG: hypothetical protein ACREVL_06545 [Solimonas sp.]